MLTTLTNICCQNSKTFAFLPPLPFGNEFVIKYDKLLEMGSDYQIAVVEYEDESYYNCDAWEAIINGKCFKIMQTH